MAFYGSEIIYDGISCSEFGLMLVGKIDSDEQDGRVLGGNISISEDSILRRGLPIFYGTQHSDPLEFKLVLSVCQDNISLSRQDMSAIAGWLYGSTQYKELAIIQDDMPDYYYRCIIVGIEQSIVAGRTVGIVLSVRCDAPYAYMSTADTIITSNNYTESLYHNRSNVNKYYRPMITVEASGGTSVISINNTGDIIGEFEISGIPSSGAIIVVDCTRCILTSEEMPDVYSSCNLNFPRFLRGANMIEVSGECVITIQNRFPMIIGT